MSSQPVTTRRRRARRAIVAVAVLGVLGVLAGGAGAAGFRSLDGSTGGDDAAPVAAPTVTDAPPTAAPGTTEGGWSLQVAGTPAVMPTSTGHGELLLVDVSDIHTGFGCTADRALPAMNGQYIALSVQVRAGDDFSDELAVYPTSATDFTALGPGGQVVQDSIGNAGSCIPADDGLGHVVTADSPATGTVVLDVPVGITAIRYVPGGWEWPTPQSQ